MRVEHLCGAKHVTIGELKPGDTFRMISGNSVFIKTDRTTTAVYGSLVCVQLSDGSFCDKGAEVYVIRVDTTSPVVFTDRP